jgi:peptidyl-prolyl cis-trans isomerase C
MKKLGFLLLSASVIAFGTLTVPLHAEEKPAAVAAPATDYTILKVGSDEIKKSEVLAIWNSIFPGGQAPDFETFDEAIKQNVLRGIVSERLLLKEAEKAGVTGREDVKKQIEQATRQITVRAFLADKAKAEITDEKIKAAYDKKSKETKADEEIKASHILVKDEAEAKKIYSEVTKGGDFEKIAKEKSEDKASGAMGGDLGFFGKGRMVKEFEETAFKLKKGEISKPVKTDFGWHIIKKVDGRTAPKPAFEQSKEAIREELTNELIQKYLNGQLKSLNIEYFGADGKTKEFKKEYPAQGLAPKP